MSETLVWNSSVILARIKFYQSFGLFKKQFQNYFLWNSSFVTTVRQRCQLRLPLLKNVICKWCLLETAVPGRAANWGQHRFSLLLPCIEATRKAFMAVGICLFYDTISPCPLQRLAKHISDSDFYISHLDPGEAIQFMYCKHNSYQLYLSVTNLYGGQSASFSSICDLHPTLSSFFGHVFSPHYLFLCGPVGQQQ